MADAAGAENTADTAGATGAAEGVLVVGEVSADTRAAVIGVVEALEKAFNAKDPVALGEQYGVRASWTNAAGRRLDGRAAITEFAAPAMRGLLADSFARYQVVKLLAITPDVVAVNVAQTPTDRGGRPVEGAHGAALYVIARQDDGWKIAAGQNTALEPGATA
ncbi:nuclear transport factor 2 family protein [Streptomonospora nanhaiensis]|uniref:Uncharacterized protein (TIGR02246 family) n=1 Tax=Streptomonospora nanhaiensis TaxID=1323731 RepID=A0A853BI82_9ACTN|nr:nuclear transport factor 2 family protein [Streptomonospora nanhaiensis]MBV2366878.1 nuclear transport factor 2 family protein [Streptomonospora nanhaiensis]MBX9387476.1 nuclear transport factor 2 family protein [Streptomonospora nanhaiensis]NYI94302.1 uncharacterized protein (TIGR02246 family) [Streptomonospora nanhaiensis]